MCVVSQECTFPKWGIQYSKVENPDYFMKGIRVEGVRIFVREGLKDMSSTLGSWNMSGDLVWLHLAKSFHFLHLTSVLNLELILSRINLNQIKLRNHMNPSELTPLHLNELNTHNT